MKWIVIRLLIFYLMCCGTLHHKMSEKKFSQLLSSIRKNNYAKNLATQNDEGLSI